MTASRMTKPGRISCVNPACHRTAPAQQFGESDLICHSCFKLLPAAIQGEVSRMDTRFAEQLAHNWQLMRDYFRHRDRPLGLEGFLQEMGMGL